MPMSYEMKVTLVFLPRDYVAFRKKSNRQKYKQTNKKHWSLENFSSLNSIVHGRLGCLLNVHPVLLSGVYLYEAVVVVIIS